MKKVKNFIKTRQLSMWDDVEGSKDAKYINDEILTYIFGTKKINKEKNYEKLKNINKKKYRNLIINKIINYLKEILKDLDIVIQDYKKLINKTEYWENKSTINFDMENWKTIKKVNGKITRYYNEIKEVQKNLEEK